MKRICYGGPQAHQTLQHPAKITFIYSLNIVLKQQEHVDQCRKEREDETGLVSERDMQS